MRGSYQVLIGDCRETLKSIDDETIHTCITSPPYYGLRDYGENDQIGLEETPEEYVEQLVSVFREVRRTLRDDGTLWLNLGDSYYNYRPGKGQRQTKQSFAAHKASEVENCPRRGRKLDGLKEKDLIGIPWRVAFALQADGWYLRQDIIWHKPNPMPESVRDRCTKTHEYIFLLSKNKNYYYDHESIKEDTVTFDENIRDREESRLNEVPGRTKMAGLTKNNYEKRNKRSVWSVNTKPYSEAHFAVYPPELIEPCVLAGCPEGGIVLDPFGGSGTTAAVAVKYGRNAVLCELNEEYAGLIESRVNSLEPEQFGLPIL